MVFMTGDCHGNFRRFSRRYFPEQETMDRDDYVIICGDFGGVWSGTPEEAYWLDWLKEHPFTTLFVDGNHENFEMLNSFPVHTWHGGTVHYVRPHVLHLMRGQLYEIGGRSFFTMGGARSHDIEDGILDPGAPDFRTRYTNLKRAGKHRFRIQGRSWWPEELPSDGEYLAALETLERVNWRADYVITHCAPTKIALSMSRHNEADALSDFLELVDQRLEYEAWFFGHFHDNRAIDRKHDLLWEQIVQML